MKPPPPTPPPRVEILATHWPGRYEVVLVAGPLESRWPAGRRWGYGRARVHAAAVLRRQVGGPLSDPKPVEIITTTDLRSQP